MKRSVDALVVTPDGRIDHRSITPDLETIKGIIGGWLEAVAYGDGWHAYANEEGRLLRLEPNPAASLLIHRLGLPTDLLVGPVVFLGESGSGEDAGAEEGDVPQHVVDAARALA